MNRFRLALFLFFGNLAAGLAQSPADTVFRTPRYPDAATWQQLRNDRAYHYIQEAPPVESIWDQLLARLMRWLGSWLHVRTDASTNEWVVIFVVASLLLFAVYQFWRLYKPRPLLQRTAADHSVPYYVANETIYSIDFDNELSQAIDQQQYRLAVRLLYLRALKLLADRALITWQVNKTNRSYAQEIDSDLRPSFHRLTDRFEYVWYGQFAPDKAQFELLQAEFREFSQLVTLTHPNS